MLRTAKITHHLSEKEIDHKWYLIDAKGVTLGKLGTQVANILSGKNKSSFTKHMNDGDKVVVINAEQVVVTGNKYNQKKYYRHSGYMGSLKETTFANMLATHPTRVIEKAVFGMLPHNRLGSRYYRNLYVYKGSEHPHIGQKPETVVIK